jgi:hypothetical protein
LGIVASFNAASWRRILPSHGQHKGKGY